MFYTGNRIVQYTETALDRRFLTSSCLFEKIDLQVSFEHKSMNQRLKSMVQFSKKKKILFSELIRLTSGLTPTSTIRNKNERKRTALFLNFYIYSSS